MSALQQTGKREVERNTVRRGLGLWVVEEMSLLMAIYVAYLFVHCLAILSCSVLLVRYCVAMLPTKGSAGLQSVSREQMDSSTLEMVRAGLQLSFRMSRQITPWLLILQW